MTNLDSLKPLVRQLAEQSQQGAGKSMFTVIPFGGYRLCILGCKAAWQEEDAIDDALTEMLKNGLENIVSNDELEALDVDALEYIAPIRDAMMEAIVKAGKLIKVVFCEDGDILITYPDGTFDCISKEEQS